MPAAQGPRGRSLSREEPQAACQEPPHAEISLWAQHQGDYEGLHGSGSTRRRNREQRCLVSAIASSASTFGGITFVLLLVGLIQKKQKSFWWFPWACELSVEKHESLAFQRFPFMAFCSHQLIRSLMRSWHQELVEQSLPGGNDQQS